MLDMGLFTYLLFILVSFIAMLAIYTPIANKSLQTLEFKPYFMPYLYIYLIYAIGTLVVYYGSQHNDFVEPLTAQRAFMPLLLAIVIFIVSVFGSRIWNILTVTGCIAITVWIQPLGEGFPYDFLPIWAIRLLLVVFFSVFCLYFGIMNLIPQSFVIPLIFMLIGISGLSALGASPAYLAVCSALLIGSLAGYISINLYTVKTPLDDASCSSLAYLVASLMLLNAGEFSFPSCLVFTVIFWSELIIAIWNKFVVEKSGSLTENTYYAKSAEKYNMITMILGVAKICMVCIFIGWFQIFSVNQYSLLIVALAIMTWLNHSFAFPTEKNNLRSINRQFVADIKKNVQDVQDTFKAVTTQNPNNENVTKSAKRTSAKSTAKSSRSANKKNKPVTKKSLLKKEKN